MLFDLRSRGRRRTVQVVYAFMALLMLGGLVLFGVGAGNGIGGLLNAFTNSGASTSNTSAISKQTRHALKLTRENPNSQHAWFQLLQARYSQAGSGSGFNASTGIYTAAGLHQLRKAGDAWQHYLKLAQKPSPEASTLAARAYSTTGNWSDAATAWEFVANAEPTSASPFICLAATAYAAKQTRKGDLATQQAVSLAPKLQRLQVKQELKTAKTSTSVAQSCG
jgi:hypothetical protein